MTKNEIEFLATRINPVLAARLEQFSIHQAAYNGGNEYKNKRLQMFPNEDRLSFDGGTRYDGSSTVGRKQYSPAISYARQIVDDITNLTFYNKPARIGGTEEIISNINGFNDDVNIFMSKLNNYYTLFGWCFLKVDYPSFNLNTQLSVLDKQSMNIRPFWFAVKPHNVVDWGIDRFGINWILEEDYQCINNKATSAPVKVKIRRLWEPGKVTIITFLNNSDKRRKAEYSVEEKSISYNGIPWVLIGTPSAEPNRFESIESLNSNILNLESSNSDIFINSCFPQQYIAERTFEKIYQQQLSRFTLSNQAGNNSALQIFDESKALDAAFNIATGTKRPMILGDGESPYVPSMPQGVELIRKEIQENIKNLQKLSGIDLNNEASQSSSGIARAFDLITVQATVNERSSLLETAEKQAVKISSEYDADFIPWEVTYNPNLTPEQVKTENNIPQSS